MFSPVIEKWHVQAVSHHSPQDSWDAFYPTAPMTFNLSG